MKIECTKDEFAALLKACYIGNEDGERCQHCALCPACTEMDMDDPVIAMCEVT